MDHCTPEPQAAWREGFEKIGVDMNGGKIDPEQHFKPEPEKSPEDGKKS